MAGGQPSLRKYIGAIKDTTTVGLAKVNSDYKELDIAIVRATNHHERPAREKYIKAIFYAISASRPRADVAYCIHALARRLSKTHNWAVALKTLIIIHRALKEVDPTFHEELINYGRSRNHMLNLAHFKDDSSPDAWDYSAWLRTYALYLEERLECSRVLKYDVVIDPPKTRDIEGTELLEQLPALQQLLHCLLGCLPQGAAVYNFVIQLALSMVTEESGKIYTAINDGIINLIDKFLDMPRHNAARALEIYRRAGKQAEMLSEFYEVCKSIDVRRGEKFVKIEQPPASFITAMEEYLKEAPLASTARKEQAVNEKLPAPNEVLAIEYPKSAEVESPAVPPPPPEPAKEEPPVSEHSDLLELNEEINVDASELDSKNALALAIVPVDAPIAPSNGFNPANGTTGWELALVTAPALNETVAAASKLGGGLDKLTLDSLYDDADRRVNQNPSYNPWDMGPMAASPMQPVAHDPFYGSSAVPAPYSVQMAVMAQQQALLMQQHMMVDHQQPHVPAGNSFGHPYMAGHQYGPGMPLQASNAYMGGM